MRMKKVPVRNPNDKIVDQYLNDKNLNEYEKMEAIKRHAQVIEQKANMQEKLIGMDKIDNSE